MSRPTLEQLIEHFEGGDRDTHSSWGYGGLLADEVVRLRGVLAEIEQMEDGSKAVEHAAEVARDALGDWRSVPDGEMLSPYDAACMRADEAEAALREIAARRDDWDKADDEHPFDIVSSFWKAIEIAEAGIGTGGVQ
jgi:hypothetical protein